MDPMAGHSKGGEIHRKYAAVDWCMMAGPVMPPHPVGHYEGRFNNASDTMSPETANMSPIDSFPRP